MVQKNLSKMTVQYSYQKLKVAFHTNSFFLQNITFNDALCNNSPACVSK